MQEENQNVKLLIKGVLEKCNQALPELTLLAKHFQRLTQGQKHKVKKKDCLNPTFLLRLSECGENIRRILTEALSREFPGKQILKRQYNQYMQVIYDIRKYHEEAHLSSDMPYDMHQHSTVQKRRLLDELKEQIQKRQESQAQLQFVISEHQKEQQEKDKIIKQLEQRLGDRDDATNISQISKISKKGIIQGQFYGGKAKVGPIEADYQLNVDTARLRKRILKLQSQLQEKDKLHREEMQSQKIEILQLQGKFQELVRSSSFQHTTMRSENIKNVKFEATVEYQQFCRLLLIQSSSIEQYIKEQQYDE